MSINFDKNIGYNVKLARKHEGLTQSQLANKVKASRTTITNIELGNQRASLELMMTISDKLNVELSDLLRLDIKICRTCGQMVKET